MKIALGQINPTVGDFSGNAAKIIDFSHQARQRGAELIAFPEMSVCGYPARDMVERPAFVERNLKTIEKIAAAVEGISVICGFVTPANEETGKLVHNSAALLHGGKIIFKQSKRLLPTYDVFDEMRNFSPAASQNILNMEKERIALTICEDAWNDQHFWPRRLYDVDPVEQLVKEHPNFILNISASPYQLRKRQVRERMLSAIATKYKKPVVLVNSVGGNDGVIFDGSSMALAPDGRVVARCKSFEEDLVLFDTKTLAGDMHDQISGREATAYQALVLGTRDYVRKCGFAHVWIGLSGGIDSALVACIAVDALGKENVCGLGMPGPYSSAGSIDDARALANNLGIHFELAPITATVEATTNAVAPIFIGRATDATEENIQARVRGTFLMSLANKFNAMVLTTGNKSELAVGYCTLYGDMAGALAVIGDVPKTMVYKLSEYANRDREIIPTSTMTKPPSAELRPDQKDTDTLPPYDILDRILEDYVEELKTVKQIAQERGFDHELVLRIVRMIERSEYKRQQAPPTLKITDKAFGVGRRFPIAVKYEV